MELVSSGDDDVWIAERVDLLHSKSAKAGRRSAGERLGDEHAAVDRCRDRWRDLDAALVTPISAVGDPVGAVVFNCDAALQHGICDSRGA